MTEEKKRKKVSNKIRPNKPKGKNALDKAKNGGKYNTVQFINRVDREYLVY